MAAPLDSYSHKPLQWHTNCQAMLEAWGNLGSCVYDVLGISSDREAVWRCAQVQILRSTAWLVAASGCRHVPMITFEYTVHMIYIHTYTPF